MRGRSGKRCASSTPTSKASCGISLCPCRPAAQDFQLKVWRTLQTIPYGETWSYGQLARRILRPDAPRAVGAANGQNPIPVIIPCHRVIGADGSLTGFGGGLPIKQKLLTLEGSLPEAKQSKLF